PPVVVRRELRRHRWSESNVVRAMIGLMSAEQPKAQIDKFRQLARKLETDDDEGRFGERLKKLAKAKVAKPAPKKPK
ncbi:MAG TPA: hypothetical protein VME40_11800, partial [Caulobacteraceae bacterium]|nr:hypothetical protein [Caulobacteraceae bacterium]